MIFGLSCTCARIQWRNFFQNSPPILGPLTSKNMSYRAYPSPINRSSFAPEGVESIVVIGRMNYAKKSKGIQTIIRQLIHEGFSVYEFEESQAKISKWLEEQCIAFKPHSLIGRFLIRDSHSNWFRRLLKFRFLLRHPDCIEFIARRLNPKRSQVSELRAFISSLPTDKINLVAHSAGGITAGIVSNDSRIKKIVCFGYPFKHPDRNEGAYRTTPLTNCRKPYLIIQGTYDEYGAPSQLAQYELTDPVKILSVNANHDYDNLTKTDITFLSHQIIDFFREKSGEDLNKQLWLLNNTRRGGVKGWRKNPRMA